MITWEQIHDKWISMGRSEWETEYIDMHWKFMMMEISSMHDRMSIIQAPAVLSLNMPIIQRMEQISALYQDS